MKTVNYAALMKTIGYEFQTISLLEEALSHRSFGRNNNERLEFLGDSIVNFVIASELYSRFPKAKEGQLSRLRANLVNEESLMGLAKEFNISAFLRLGPGEMKSGGAQRVSILADTLEAIVAAIFLDSGIEVCYQCVLNWYQTKLNALSPDSVCKDPKSLLQELLQSRQLPLPEYRLLELKGAEHNQQFVVECRVALLDHPICAEGASRRKGEQLAAELTLKELKHDK